MMRKEIYSYEKEMLMSKATKLGYEDMLSHMRHAWESAYQMDDADEGDIILYRSISGDIAMWIATDESKLRGTDYYEYKMIPSADKADLLPLIDLFENNSYGGTAEDISQFLLAHNVRVNGVEEGLQLKALESSIRSGTMAYGSPANLAHRVYVNGARKTD